jgi:hypothetical protein
MASNRTANSGSAGSSYNQPTEVPHARALLANLAAVCSGWLQALSPGTASGSVEGEHDVDVADDANVDPDNVDPDNVNVNGEPNINGVDNVDAKLHGLRKLEITAAAKRRSWHAVHKVPFMNFGLRFARNFAGRSSPGTGEHTEIAHHDADHATVPWEEACRMVGDVVDAKQSLHKKTEQQRQEQEQKFYTDLLGARFSYEVHKGEQHEVHNDRLEEQPFTQTQPQLTNRVRGQLTEQRHRGLVESFTNLTDNATQSPALKSNNTYTNDTSESTVTTDFPTNGNVTPPESAVATDFPTNFTPPSVFSLDGGWAGVGEHAKFKYLIDIDGWGISNRLTWVMQLGSLVFKVM